MLAVLAAAPPAVASAAIPRQFVGMTADGPVFDPGVNVGSVLNDMAASGVGRLRVPFSWADAQPYASFAEVPPSELPQLVPGPGGVPTNFSFTDLVVSAAAESRLSLLPVVTYAPAWDASPDGNHAQPARDGPYARYLTALVQRYGRHGTFWTANPALPKEPITAWQVWNEEDLTTSWDTVPFAPSYVALLRAARSAIKTVDPTATVVLGALTNYGWRDLASIYSVPGSRNLFDAVAANAYTRDPAGVITILRNYRHVMATNGDGAKPLVATEVGWSSSLGKTSHTGTFSVTEQGQARRVSQLLPMLAHNRRSLGLAAFYYYTWMTTDPPNGNPFQFSGLLHYDVASNTITPKPAYWAFRRTVKSLEG